MGSSERRNRERQAVRSRLLEVSWELLTTLPAQEVTMRLIAERAEYSPRTLYLYFADKEALLAAVVEEAFRRTLAHQEVPETGNPETFLVGHVFRHVSQGLARPRLYETIFYELWRPGAKVGRYRAELEGQMVGLLATIGSPAPELGPVFLRTLTLTLIREGRSAGDPEVVRRVDAFCRMLGLSDQAKPA